MAITFRQLEIFVAVAETSQVTKASKALDLTQSAVSMALSELEGHLGGPLFDRYGRSLLLNDRGRYLLPYAKEMLQLSATVEARLTGLQDAVAGNLQIVASSTIGNYVMPYLIGAFMRKFPEAHINMLVVNARQAQEMVAEGKADLGFVGGNVDVDGLTARPWFNDELGVIVSPRHALANQSTFRVPEDLRKTPWVVREDGSGSAGIFIKRLGKYVRQLNVLTKTGHTEAIKREVEEGVGAAWLSKLTVAREAEAGWLKLLDIEGMDPRLCFWIIQYKDKVVTRLMKEFVAFCMEAERADEGMPCVPAALSQAGNNPR